MPSCAVVSRARLRPALAPARGGAPSSSTGVVLPARFGRAAPAARPVPSPGTQGPHKCQAFNRGPDGGPDFGDRVIAALPYFLPLLDSIPFGKFIFLQFPFVGRALAPLAPFNYVYNAIPFGPFIAFLGVYAGIVNNQNLPRFVRYQAAQAVVLDILLIIPQVLLSTFRPGDDGFGLQAYISAYNTLFLFMIISSFIGIGASLTGQVFRLPLVADAADTQVRDF